MNKHHATTLAEAEKRIAIIGGGSAGMACAATALEGGAQVTLIEHHNIGGAAVHTKKPVQALCEAARQRADIATADKHPAILSGVAQERFEKEAREQLEALLAHPSFTWMAGEARFLAQDTLIVRLNDDSKKRSFRKVRFDRCLIAAGSLPDVPQIAGLGDTPYWTAKEAVSCPALPATLAVIGTSATALALAHAFALLGSRVMLLAHQDAAAHTLLRQQLAADGVVVQAYSEISNISYGREGFTIATGQRECHADRLLVATATLPNTWSLCLDMVGITIDAEGYIPVDEQQQTNLSGVYAAGSCATSCQHTPSVVAGHNAAMHMTR